MILIWIEDDNKKYTASFNQVDTWGVEMGKIIFRKVAPQNMAEKYIV